MEFSQLGLDRDLLQALDDSFAFESPTACQEAAVGPLLEGQPLILQAMTGSGKTMAYLLPLWQRIAQSDEGVLLILAPSQELAMQLVRTARALGKTYPQDMPVAALVGAGNIRHQIEALKEKPRILIGTPGRVMDLFEQKKINGQVIQAWVLDEADALWQEDQGAHLQALQKKLLRDVQKVAVSASYAPQTMSWLQDAWPQAQVIRSQEAVVLNPDIRHFFLRTSPRDRFDHLRRLLAATAGSQSLIFLNRPDDIDRLVDRLAYHHYPALALHAQMKDRDRQKAFRLMATGQADLLVATDVMARGIDLPGIDQVLHLDFPLSPLSYVHRAGRTGRAGRPGSSVAFASLDNEAALRIYERDLGIAFEEIHLHQGQVYLGPAPEKPAPKPKKKPAKGRPRSPKRRKS